MKALFPFLSKVTEIFCKIESKFLNFRVLAGDIVMESDEKVLVFSIYKKLIEKSEIWKLTALTRSSMAVSFLDSKE